MNKKIVYITLTAALIVVAFFVGRNTAEPESENLVNMRNVIDFTFEDDRFQLYFNDGTGYYWGP